MIDSRGDIRCDGCGTKFGHLEGDKLIIVCHKSRCKRYNVFSLVKKVFKFKNSCVLHDKMV